MVKLKSEKDRILNHCFTKFLGEGFRKTSMEVLAKELGISKKTLYKHFSSKEHLIDATLEVAFKTLKQNLNHIVVQNTNAVVKLRMIAEFILSFAVRVNEKWLNDLRHHGNNRWKKVDENRRKLIEENFDKIIDQGKADGTIIDRPNLLILQILISAIEGVINPSFLINNEISLKQAGEFTFDILFSGILTKKGRKIYKQYKSGNQNEIKF
ncbi:MAG: TetR/AcrR family transcriptional regulator [Ignavibacteriae bacterium]|jgi:AcrR family transcriptional regulator|nr:TetR/AcrR family transcriptional regulator [Ignavibacteriota bacterium]